MALDINGNYGLPQLRKSRIGFSFAHECCDSLQRIILTSNIPMGIEPIPPHIEVIFADIPLLLRLDILDRINLIPEVPCDVLTKICRIERENDCPVDVEEWIIPICRAPSCRTYASMRTTTLTNLTRLRLQKLICQFFHLFAAKLNKLLNRYRPEDKTPATKNIPEDIRNRCIPCRKINRAPNRFGISLGAGDVQCNGRILPVKCIDFK